MQPRAHATITTALTNRTEVSLILPLPGDGLEISSRAEAPGAKGGGGRLGGIDGTGLGGGGWAGTGGGGHGGMAGGRLGGKVGG